MEKQELLESLNKNCDKALDLLRKVSLTNCAFNEICEAVGSVINIFINFTRNGSDTTEEVLGGKIIGYRFDDASKSLYLYPDSLNFMGLYKIDAIIIHPNTRVEIKIDCSDQFFTINSIGFSIEFRI
jgi:hypothetical protein